MAQWNTRFAAYRAAHPLLASEFERRMAGELPRDFEGDAACLPRLGVEAGVTRWWGQYGCCAALGVDNFGESAPAAQVYEHFDLTAERLAARVQAECEEEQSLVRSSN